MDRSGDPCHAVPCADRPCPHLVGHPPASGSSGAPDAVGQYFGTLASKGIAVSKRRAPGPRGVPLPIDGDWQHGTNYGYDKRGCRCDPCRDAGRARRVAQQEEYRKRPIPAHGLTAYTTYRCRCRVCLDAWNAYTARHRQRRNATTKDSAWRDGTDITGPDLEIAARLDLRAVDAARMIGRTEQAVRNYRAALKREPQVEWVAGLPRGKD